MQTRVFALESAAVSELYLTATASAPATPAQQARDLFGAMADILADQRARIFAERIFVPARAVPLFKNARIAAYRDLADDVVEPAWLALPDLPASSAAVQIHALRAAAQPATLSVGDLRGRIFDLHGCRWLTASGLHAPNAGDGPAQVCAAFTQAEQLLAAAGGDLRSLARTWIFIDDIHAWYDRFNAARNAFFAARGLIDPAPGPRADPLCARDQLDPARGLPAAVRLPASTGIGVSPAAGNQRPAHEYGSAFARAALARSPAGQTLFISGTAAIDAAGATCYVNAIPGQIRMTLDNVRAVLHQFSAADGDVVQAIAYCANPQVRDAFLQHWAPQVPWPWLVVRADVCRPDLLFEVEATACPGARHIG